MMKEEIDINSIIENAYAEREIGMKEYRAGLRLCKKIDEFIESLNHEQKEMFERLQDMQVEENFNNEKRLIDFVLNFINATRK